MSLRVLALVALSALLAAPADAGSPPPEPVRCICRDGNACYHWLNSPLPAPWDPCSCPNCRNEHTCLRTYPADWSPVCARSGRLDCFLRRHSESWKLACSAETGDCTCPGGNSASCPECGEGGKNDKDTAPLAAIRKQYQLESKLLSNTEIVCVRSPHFYLVNDIPGLKVLTQNGSKRELGTHELAHLYIQRAELAYKDFVRTFGEEIRTSRPIAIFLNKRREDSERVQSLYFGRPNAGYVYGIRGENTPPISGGICEAGVAASLEAQPFDDSLHIAMRTSIGSVLMSLWHRDNATPPHLPMWVMVGAGHWLGRVPEPFWDKAYFVGGEGNAPIDLGREWMKRLAEDFLPKGLPNADSYFGFTTLSQMDLASHIRSWAMFKLFLDEDHDRFVQFLKLVREAKNQRESALAVFGVTPDELDARWRERVTGKKKTLADERPAAASAPGGPAPSEIGFGELAHEHDPRIVADRIKARKSIDDVEDAKILVTLLARDDDPVTERVVLSLSQAKDDAVRKYLRGEALESNRGRVKAGVLRILALAKDRDAADFAAKLLVDSDPIVREQAAVLVGRVRHLDAIPALRKLVADADDSVAMAAMDAFAAIGEYAGDEWTAVATRLADKRRCVRTCAVECLGALGSMASIDALIARMETEGGRVRADIRDALKRITRDDLGVDPANWKKWWEAEKAKTPNGLPKRPPEKPPAERANSRYATESVFYGVEMFSKRLAFVVDVSSSMSDRIALDPEWMLKSGRNYKPMAEKYDLAVAEIGAALKTLDQRTQFDVVTFRSDAEPWRDRLISVSSGSSADALKFLQKQHPVPLASAGDPSRQKTNLVDALRLVFGMRPGISGRPTDEAADEAYVLTDGQPTAGDLTDADVLMQWFREKNRTARVRVNVFTFETVDVDLTFLRALAVAGDGVFVAVPTAKR